MKKFQNHTVVIGWHYYRVIVLLYNRLCLHLLESVKNQDLMNTVLNIAATLLGTFISAIVAYMIC